MSIKIIKMLCLIFSSLLVCSCVTACTSQNITMDFDSHCKITENGFKYYYNDNSNEGAYIIEIPDDENLIIPEYINGRKVVELGHCDTGIGYMNDYFVVGNNTKTLTIQHQFKIRNKAPVKYYVDFPNLTKLIFVDFLYCNITTSAEEIIVPYFIGKQNSNIPTVELRKSERTFSLESFEPKVIIIPEYVEIIETDVFSGLTNVTIKTSYESKPEGWEDGWNGSCEVVWGFEASPHNYEKENQRCGTLANSVESPRPCSHRAHKVRLSGNACQTEPSSPARTAYSVWQSASAVLGIAFFGTGTAPL